MTLSGGASLGAYEAGAAAGLALAVRYLDSEENQEATIDALGGASAGALVSFFTAHALLEGLDPEALLHETWVERVSLPLLRSGDSTAILSFDELRERAPDVLAADGPARPDDDFEYRQNRPLALQVQVTGLRGLTYPIRGLREERPIAGTTYADWGRFELQPGGGTEQMLEPPRRSPFDFVLASASSPGGFAPRLLDRRSDIEGYRHHGIERFPKSGHLWYTDGGVLGSRPLGHVVAAGRELHGGDSDESREVLLLIDPRSENASLETWSDPDAEPTWQTGASRALAILSEQSLFDDLRRIEKENSRIEWADRLARELSAHLDEDAAHELRGLIEDIAGDPAGRDDEDGSTDRAAEADLSDLLLRALCEIAGLAGKERVAIDVISPLVLSDDEEEGEVGSLLAGEFMGDFGGFLDRELRASDFALGYQSTLTWLERGLSECGLEDEVVDRAVAFVESRRRYDPEEVRSGEARVSDLSLADRLELVRLGAHAARVLGSGVLDVRSRIRDGLGRAIDRAREIAGRGT